MRFKVRKRYIFLLLIAIILFIRFDVWQYLGVIWRVTLTPEKAYEKFEYGHYSSWAWTPDGQIIYVKNIRQMEHTKGMGTMGYKDLGTVTQIKIINPDGTGDKLIKEIFYQGVRQKLIRRYNDLRKQNNGRLPMRLSDQANRESSDGTLDKIYPDAPLAHIGWIDWNGKNNKLVFVANDGRGKTGIAVSDPEFKEVRWIEYEDQVYRPLWNKDGDKLVYVYGYDIYIIDLKGKTTKQITQGHKYRSVFWLNNKKLLTNIGIIDLNGKMIDRFTEINALDPSISPDGQWVVYFAVHTEIMDINGKNKRVLYPYGGHFYPKWSPDGKKILMGWEYAIEVINSDGSNFFVVTGGSNK